MAQEAVVWIMVGLDPQGRIVGACRVSFLSPPGFRFSTVLQLQRPKVWVHTRPKSLLITRSEKAPAE